MNGGVGVGVRGGVGGGEVCIPPLWELMRFFFGRTGSVGVS